eukprot:TRINITY_DN37775_c0_g1_i2.p1 TRINITY_DN37775_c0_g1~~TRINITY_DN37775_c0_g1_i2.p1  ORF type:complete len:139 (+),score=11.26 TRINITY_DN37775_c0_g1_i2:65-481(+)
MSSPNQLSNEENSSLPQGYGYSSVPLEQNAFQYYQQQPYGQQYAAAQDPYYGSYATYGQPQQLGYPSQHPVDYNAAYANQQAAWQQPQDLATYYSQLQQNQQQGYYGQPPAGQTFVYPTQQEVTERGQPKPKPRKGCC